jgi:2-oxoglutarate ferredoxin oxidoreductase subunit alpha
VLVVEQNFGGQFHKYLRAEYDIDAEIRSFRHPGPLPVRPDEVYRELTEWSRA